MTSKKSSQTKLKRAWQLPFQAVRGYWQTGWWQKVLTVGLITVIVCVALMYGIARWYIWSERSKPFELGASFIPAYAENLGVDPEETLTALTDDVGIRDFRLVSYWDQIELQPDIYDFSQLDWQFRKIESVNGNITLSLGLRQPRWPECHMPDWARKQPPEVWQGHLEDFMTQIVNRYKNSPALESYQVENEFFLKGFGICEDIPGGLDRSRLVSEYKLVKKLDPKHKVIINRSNNALGWPVGDPQPDEFGISIYKRVWDAKISKRYLEYPLPSWFYAFTAGWQKIFTGKDMIIHELQAESWGPNGKNLNEISVEEANKSFNAERFKDRIDYGKDTGMKEAYLWGAEYWYYREQVQRDPSLMDVARDAFRNQ